MAEPTENDKVARRELREIFQEILTEGAVELFAVGLSGGKWKLANGVQVEIRIKHPRPRSRA